MTSAYEETQGFSTFCDDIREEISQKTTLVGIYGGQMLVSGACPIVIPQLCYMGKIIISPSNIPSDLQVLLKRYSDDGEVIEIGRIDFPPLNEEQFPPIPKSYGPGAPRLQAQAALRMSPLPVEGDSTIRAILMVDGKEKPIGSLTISVVESLP